VLTLAPVISQASIGLQRYLSDRLKKHRFQRFAEGSKTIHDERRTASGT
jgi:hypothetical protein